MGKADQNRRFILRYINALNEADDKLLILSDYTSDSKLIERIAFLEEAFPHYQIIVDEVTAEAKRVILRARLLGNPADPMGRTENSPKTVQIPFAIGYHVEQEEIVGHWLIIDQLGLLRPSKDVAL